MFCWNIQNNVLNSVLVVKSGTTSSTLEINGNTYRLERNIKAVVFLDGMEPSELIPQHGVTIVEMR